MPDQTEERQSVRPILDEWQADELFAVLQRLRLPAVKTLAYEDGEPLPHFDVVLPHTTPVPHLHRLVEELRLLGWETHWMPDEQWPWVFVPPPRLLPGEVEEVEDVEPEVRSGRPW